MIEDFSERKFERMISLLRDIPAYTWICIVPHRRHTFKAVRYNTCYIQLDHSLPVTKYKAYLPLLPATEHHRSLACTHFPSY